MSGVEQEMLDPDETRDAWPELVLFAAALEHTGASILHPTLSCVGYTMLNAGRARCWRCDWQASARIRDVGSIASATFVFLVLGRIGQVFARAQQFAEQLVAQGHEDALDQVSDVRLDGIGGITFVLNVDIRQVTFTHKVDL